MTPATLRALELAHGVVAWLALAALVAAAILALRRSDGRRALVAVAIATLLVTVAAALGFALHADFDARLRQHLFIRSATLGWMFERKQHFAVVAVLLAWSGALAELARRAFPREKAQGRDALARTVGRSFVAAAGLAAFAAVVGAVVARVARF
jgi:hypothetical protein